MSSPHSADMAALEELLDMLPIYATRIGFHVESTDKERAFGNLLFDLNAQWNEWRGAQA